MSTRCNIIIKDRWNRRITLYHHCDGYPEFVGACLADYLGELKPWQIRQHTISIANDLVKKGIKYETRDWQTGERVIKTDEHYEITAGLHGDIEYCYVINGKSATLRCYEVPWELKGEKFGWEPCWKRVFTREHLIPIPGWDYIPDNQNPALSAE